VTPAQERRPPYVHRFRTLRDGGVSDRNSDAHDPCAKANSQHAYGSGFPASELCSRDEVSSGRLETVLFAGGFLLSLGYLAILVASLWTGAFGGPGRSAATDFGFEAGRSLIAVVAIFYGCRGAAFLVLPFLARRWSFLRPPLEPGSFPKVSILVPCFNESDTIVPALESLLEIDYPHYEIIVIDDGSTDDTRAKAQRYEGVFGRVTVRVFGKPNGGKWSALNFGMQRASAELLLCVDADSRLSHNALRYLTARIHAEGVAVVAGQVRVRNRSKLICQLQALEYQLGNGVRMAQGLLGMVLVVPGPLGLFRRSAMEEVMIRYGRFDNECSDPTKLGPYEHDTFAEDFDLSMAILALRGKTAYEPRAVSFTKAPDSAFALISQRYRWFRGSFQVLRKFFRRLRAEVITPSPALLAWIGLTYLPDLLLTPVLAPTALVLVLLSLVETALLWPVLAMIAGLLVAQCCIAGFFLSLHNDSFRLLQVLPLHGPYNAFLLGSAWLISVLDEMRGSAMRW